MATSLRLLLRRRAEAPSAPSLALLQPLFPRPYSKLSAPPVPSFLRRTSGEGCSALLPVPRKPTDRGREATQRPIQPSSPLLAASAIYNIPGMQRVQIHPSPPHVPSLIRHYSSKGCAPPLPQQPIDPQTCQCLKQAQSLLRAVNSLAEYPALMLKGIETREKACDLLGAGEDDDKVFAMFEKGLDDALNALVVYEKNLDGLAKALGSTKGVQLGIDLEPDQMMRKEIKNSFESMRQELKELHRSRESRRTLEKIRKWLEFANVVLQASFLLLLLLLLLITMGIIKHFLLQFYHGIDIRMELNVKLIRTFLFKCSGERLCHEHFFLWAS